jgi:hypothetical protein
MSETDEIQADVRETGTAIDGGADVSVKRSGRDNFGSSVRNFIARQVAYRCSNPDCGAPTIGPSAEVGKIVDVGVAAHITAASPNGPRYDPTLTPEQRKHEDNAIWLCQTCGKKVDSDESTHTVAQLRRWKADAIELAARALRLRDIDPDGRIKLARETRHNTAKRALTAGFKVRNAIREGVRVSAEAKRMAHSDPFGEVARQGLQGWLERSNEALIEGNAALIEVRVVWGRDLQRGAIGLIELLACLMRWRSEFAEELLCLVEGRHRQPPSTADGYDWDWEHVFDGDEDDCKRLHARLDRDINTLEGWAAAFIAGRPT